MKGPTKTDLGVFKQILDAGRRSKLLTSTQDTAPYSTDWTGQFSAPPAAVLFPESTQQVSNILSHCSKEKIAVVPQGGLTGLVGGGVPRDQQQVVLNVSKMDAIIAIDQSEGVGSFQSGVVLQAADAELSKCGLMAPIDLASKGSCQMGGLVACNAGGTRLRRYGGLHANCAGLEVVLASGAVLDLRRCLLRKNNTGLDLKHLFIGSEGTLGVVTKVDLFCPKRPTASSVAVLAVDLFDLIPTIYDRAQRLLGNHLSAFEFWDAESERLFNKHLARGIRKDAPPFSVLIEGHGHASDTDDSLQHSLQALLEDLSSEGLLKDALLASDTAQADSFWAVREGISEACAKEGHVVKYDISLPITQMYKIVQLIRLQFPAAHPLGFGHLGDGNLHLNVILRERDDDLKRHIDRAVFDHVHSVGGSISAEHGIGQLKHTEYLNSTDPPTLAVCQSIKHQLDPRGIMNPGILFPCNKQ